jgi:hypothetical protein
VSGGLKNTAFLLVFSALAVLLTIACLRLFGGMEAWQQWRIDHYGSLLAWRLALYISLAVVWLKLKARLHAGAPHTSRKRLLRIEILVVLLGLLIEVSRLAFEPGAPE